MTKIEQIEWAIHLAKQEKSRLTPEVLALEGMSSPKVRHLYNNLGAMATGYIEIGSWKGCSFISTCYGNEIHNAVAIDNFSEFDENKVALNSFKDSLLKFRFPVTDVEIKEMDCWEVDAITIGKKNLAFKPDLYLMDGAHDFESHRKAVTHFFPMMADRFVFVVDDFSNPDFHAVKEGTLAGLSDVKDQYKVVKDWELWEEGEGSVRWWNGLGIFLIERI